MSKSKLDHSDARSDARLKQFAEIDRKTAPEGSHPAAKAAHRQTLDRKGSKRAEEFARIERGKEA